MEEIKNVLKLIATEWSTSDCKEAVDAAIILKDVLKTQPVDKEWDDPQGIRCSPPDLSHGAAEDDQGVGRIVKMIR